VLGGTGPVGQRVARLLARRGAAVGVASRSGTRAEEVVRRLEQAVPGATFFPVEWPGGRADASQTKVVGEADVIVAAGAAGATLLDARGRAAAVQARVLIDLNAVPPAGIEGILATDKARTDGAAFVYGPLGVGGTKMKIHRAGINAIFDRTAPFLDAEELLALGATG
jgi:glutamyl-tRNA reductase